MSNEHLIPNFVRNMPKPERQPSQKERSAEFSAHVAQELERLDAEVETLKAQIAALKPKPKTTKKAQEKPVEE